MAQPDDAPVAAPREAADAAADAVPSPTLPEGPEFAAAREAYNAARYDEAARRFRALAVAHPEMAAVYRALARASTWAGDPRGAALAYRHYLQLAPDAGDRAKVEAELQLVLKKVDPPLPEGPPAEATAALATVRERVEAGLYPGNDGAFAALTALIKSGYVGPEIGEARRAIREGLSKGSEAAIEAWWRVDAQARTETLAGLAAGWKTQAEQGALSPAEAAQATAVEGLAHLAAGRDAPALAALGPVAPGDPRLRFAQALALARADRLDEAAQLLDVLANGDAPVQVLLLRGHVRQKQGRPDAAEALQAALEAGQAD